MPLTIEQQAVVEASLNKNDSRILAVNAKAGSGKSSTLRAVIEAYKPTSGLVSAFNKAIIEDTKKKLGKLIPCSTIHALAYKYAKPSKGIEDFNYLSIKDKDLSYEDKNIIITTLDDFYRSAYINLQDYLDATCPPNFHAHAIKYANEMLDGKIPGTFNYMLKAMHIMLYHKEIEIDFDFLAIDECQDTTSVALEIFKLIHANKKIIIGDEFQNIYSFMKTVNAFNKLDNLHELQLTQSFRCAPHIAQYVEDYGKSLLKSNFRFRGNDAVKKSEQTEIAYITRTNSALIDRMYSLLASGKTFSLTRSINEIFALPISLLMASKGKPVYDKRYKYLEIEFKRFTTNSRGHDDYFHYIVATTGDPLIDSVIKTLKMFSEKKINIFNLKEKVTNMKPNPKIILTTAHAFKGLEMDTAHIEEDMNNCVKRVLRKDNMIAVQLGPGAIKEHRTVEEQEDLNTYYVGLSRAKTKLINANYLGY